MNKLFFPIPIFIFSLSACAPIDPIDPIKNFTNENVRSTPHGATIHWGSSNSNLQRTNEKTPFFKRHSSATIGPKCYRVTMEGYTDSETICHPEQSIVRNVYFKLSKIPVVIEDNTVSISGAASALRKITTTETHELNPRLSPDKRWLLMQVHESGNKASYKSVLQKINVDNSSRVILTQKNNDSRNGDWLPDSSAIVFNSDKLGNLTIVQSLGVTGGSAVKFITPPSFSPAMHPDVSPDGRQIAFSLYQSEDKNQVCVVNIDGSNLRVYGDGYNPKWSSNGKEILFTRKVGKYSRIYTMDSATGDNLVELSSTESNDKGAVWSQDSKKIAFISNRINNRDHLFLMDKNGQNIVQLTDGNFDVNSIDWGMDNYIYFSSNAGGNLDIWRLRSNL